MCVKKKELSDLFREQNVYLDQLLRGRKLKHPEVDVELYEEKYDYIEEVIPAISKKHGVAMMLGAFAVYYISKLFGNPV